MMMRHYLRQYAAWAIGLWERYGSDVFFRTTVRIVALESLLVLLYVGAFVWVLTHPREELLAFILLTAASVGCGVVLAEVTLRPARQSLTYQKLFISNVAHELRTPLSTIKTSTEVALLGEKVPPPVRRVLHDIVGELDRISEIINNLLSLNTLTRPERMQFGNIDLGPILETVLARHQAFAKERGITLTLTKEPHLLVWGNTTALEQVCTNVIKNAISYTPKNTGGHVTVQASPDYHGLVTVVVQDTGIGISQEDLEHILEPFYRADTSRVRNVKKTGAGLGLTIVSEIVRAHHGKLTIESKRRSGTTVTVALPSGTPPRAIPWQRQDIRNHIAVDFSRRG